MFYMGFVVPITFQSLVTVLITLGLGAESSYSCRPGSLGYLVLSFREVRKSKALNFKRPETLNIHLSPKHF